MDFIFELIFELLFEGGMEVSKNRKISKWIRYPILGLIALFFIAIIGLILFMGISILKDNILGGVFIFGFGIFMFVLCILKFKKFCNQEKNIKNNKKIEL